MRWLIVVAHPDDEILGAGALMMQALQNGDSVKVTIMNGTDVESRPHMTSDIVKSHNVLGIKDRTVCSFKNLHLNDCVHEMVQFLEHEIADFKPDYVVTHFYGDIHPDHKAVFSAVEQAVRLAQRHKTSWAIKGFYCMNIPSSTNWGHDSFKPDTYIGFDESTMACKINALKVYKNVMRDSPHPRSERSIIAYAIGLGADVGLEFAEGFKCVWRIGW